MFKVLIYTKDFTNPLVAVTKVVVTNQAGFQLLISINHSHTDHHYLGFIVLLKDRGGYAGLCLPEAQPEGWLAQFSGNLSLYFMVRCVQRDRQSHSVCVVDLHHHRVHLCTLSSVRLL